MNECPLKSDHFKRKGSSEPTINFQGQNVSFQGGDLINMTRVLVFIEAEAQKTSATRPRF